MAQGALKMGQMQSKHIARSVEWLSREYAALDSAARWKRRPSRPHFSSAWCWLFVSAAGFVPKHDTYYKHTQKHLNSVAARFSLAYT